MKILVAIDESDSGHEALQQALRLMAHQDIAFTLLGVEEPQFVLSASSLLGMLGEDPSIAW